MQKNRELWVTDQVQIGENFSSDDDAVELNISTSHPFRVRYEGSTKFRIFNNGAISLLSNWGSPQANSLFVNGKIGVMQASPQYPLHVTGAVRFDNSAANDYSRIQFNPNTGLFESGASMSMYNESNLKTAEIGAGTVLTDFGFVNLYDSDGVQNIRISAETSDLRHSGLVEVKSNGVSKIILDADYDDTGVARAITDELEIRGGSDLSELFEVKVGDEVKPGFLVSIDPFNEGHLRLTSEPYDQRVAGVVSGANGIRTGILMGQVGSISYGQIPIALVGRAYVYATSEGGKILPGDLLTSSSRSGYAMKVKRRSRSKGAIVGKAMSALNDKEGLVLVLINLQ